MGSGEGTKAIAVGYKALYAAADQLAAIGSAPLRGLKIRSGEHIAAILLTTFLRTPPVRVDTSGEVDLLFQVPAQGACGGIIGPDTTVAVEVKSVPGPFREYDSNINRRSDNSPVADAGVTVRAESARDVLGNAQPLLRKAATQLARSPDGDSRHVFLLVHTFDQFAVETVGDLPIAAVLQPPPAIDGIDFLWVLWVPDQLTLWSATDRAWTQLFVSGYNPEDPPLDPWLSVLQGAEDHFLAAIGYSAGSPYLFGIADSESPRDQAHA